MICIWIGRFLSSWFVLSFLRALPNFLFLPISLLASVELIWTVRKNSVQFALLGSIAYLGLFLSPFYKVTLAIYIHTIQVLNKYQTISYSRQSLYSSYNFSSLFFLFSFPQQNAFLLSLSSDCSLLHLLSHTYHVAQCQPRCTSRIYTLYIMTACSSTLI